MSARMKKPLIKDYIEVTVHDKHKKQFTIARHDATKLLAFLNLYHTDSTQINTNEFIPANEVFKDLDKKYGKIGATIRGFRSRNNITQKELAKKLNIAQSHISQMEHGKRSVGKKMAQKLAKIFKTNYRLFL